MAAAGESPQITQIDFVKLNYPGSLCQFGLLCGPLRISAISALKQPVNAEIAEIRRDRREIFTGLLVEG